jgi:hypothetical protein
LVDQVEASGIGSVDANEPGEGLVEHVGGRLRRSHRLAQSPNGLATLIS